MRTILMVRIIGLFLMILIGGCENKREDNYQRIVMEWQSREILFPDSMTCVGDSVPFCIDKEFMIVAYYDSLGCAGCRMKLSNWREFKNKVDSFVGPDKVGLLLISDREDVLDLNDALLKTNLAQNLYHDKEGVMNRLNTFPKQKELQTFLLGKNHTVLIVGSPLMSAKMEKLYLDRIMADSSASVGEVKEYEEYGHDFGSIMPDEEVSHIFEMKNESPDTLKVSKVLTSCECTFGTVIPEKIPPHSVYRVETTFRDTVAGSFLRSVTVYFDNRPEIRFELTGVIK